MTFYIDYQTGMDRIEVNGDLRAAMRAVENDLGYTQKSVYIYNDDGYIVACLPWWGYTYDEDDGPIVKQFGDWGWYGEWDLTVWDPDTGRTISADYEHNPFYTGRLF